MTEDNSIVWVDQKTLDTVFTFICEGGLNHFFTEVDPSSSQIEECFLPNEIRGFGASMMVCHPYPWMDIFFDRFLPPFKWL